MVHCKKMSLQVRMCDEDVLRRFASVVEVGKVYGPYVTRKTGGGDPSKWRDNFMWSARGADAEATMEWIAPYLGERRLAKLASVKERVTA
jgi:hypothetical protein